MPKVNAPVSKDHRMTLSSGHIVSLERENRWTALLAVLIETDPNCATQPLGLGDRPHLSVSVPGEKKEPPAEIASTCFSTWMMSFGAWSRR
jgi:hypothetical protein